MLGRRAGVAVDLDRGEDPERRWPTSSEASRLRPGTTSAAEVEDDSSPSLRSFRGNATAAQRSPGRSAPAELVEAVVVDAEVVGDLVDDGDADLLDHLGLGAAHRRRIGRRKIVMRSGMQP